MPEPKVKSSAIGDRLLEAAFVAGAGLIIVGVWQVYHPAAYIIAGVFLLAGAWLIARKSA